MSKKIYIKKTVEQRWQEAITPNSVDTVDPEPFFTKLKSYDSTDPQFLQFKHQMEQHGFQDFLVKKYFAALGPSWMVQLHWYFSKAVSSYDVLLYAFNNPRRIINICGENQYFEIIQERNHYSMINL